MARRRRAIVHIGVEKTGTTSIQRFLAANRPAMRAMGYWFPRSLGDTNHIKLCGLAQSQTPKFPTINHILDITSQADRRAFDSRTKQALDEEIAGLPDSIHTLIFSNEHLHSNLLEHEEVENLRTLLSAYCDAFSIIGYLRRQDELSVSLFSTRIKGGEEWKSPFPPVDGPDALPYYFDYTQILDNYVAGFGRASVIPRVFDRKLMKDNDLVSDFLHATGIEYHSSLVKVPRQNESLSRAALYTLSLLNRPIPPWIDGKWNMNRDNLVEILEEKFSTHEPLTSRQEVEAFYELFRSSNEAVRAKFFPQLPTLFDEDFSKYPAVGAVLPTLEEVTDMFSLLWNRRSEIARRNAGIAAHAATLKAQQDMAAALQAGKPLESLVPAKVS